MENENESSVGIIDRLKSFLKRTAVLQLYYIFVHAQWLAEDRARYRRWLKNGKEGAPPHRIKAAVVKDFAKRFGLKCLVETGTYNGHMIVATQKFFEQIYSIELFPPLFERAKERFRRLPNVSLFQGDSGDLLPHVMSLVDQPILFWLYAHYSGDGTGKGVEDTPILRELLHIRMHPEAKNSVILIDDARCFGAGMYPQTIDEVKRVARESGYDGFEVLWDIIRIFPKEYDKSK